MYCHIRELRTKMRFIQFTLKSKQRMYTCVRVCMPFGFGTGGLVRESNAAEILCFSRQSMRHQWRRPQNVSLLHTSKCARLFILSGPKNVLFGIHCSRAILCVALKYFESLVVVVVFFWCLLLSFRCCMFISFRCHQSVSAPSTTNEMNIRGIMTKYLIAKPHSLYQPIATSKLKVNSYTQWWCRWFALVPLNVEFFSDWFLQKRWSRSGKKLRRSRMSDSHLKRLKYRLIYLP